MPTLVMLHGLFGHLHVPEIEAEYVGWDLCAPDLMGYGTYADSNTSHLSLSDQVEHVIGFIEALGSDRVHLLGHSVGGAVAMLVAHRRPDLLKSLCTVEGNFTLKDAFWSAKIAETDDAEVEAIVQGYRQDPDAWMAGAIDEPSDLTRRLAREWLDNQPASTIKAQARAVVDATTPKNYLSDLRAVLESDLPVHLIAGSRSADGWDVPRWANNLCATRFNIPRTGHLMMVENPKAFAKAVQTAIDFG
ncbi:alpha/beta hydrolase [uncultured Litoreibacter sp.]|uniref:alpha/beta fold hydrolase n=1 Tax=uncultured Litoreibacter sp. TaxID=1392394 RepID=UPI00262A0F15|nr:alpha/beta hydrolase [uncultured Litoreibacter sp.]